MYIRSNNRDNLRQVATNLSQHRLLPNQLIRPTKKRDVAVNSDHVHDKEQTSKSTLQTTLQKTTRTAEQVIWSEKSRLGHTG